MPRVLAQERTRKFVPKDEGTIEASIFVEHASPSDLTAQVGTDSPYAILEPAEASTA